MLPPESPVDDRCCNEVNQAVGCIDKITRMKIALEIGPLNYSGNCHADDFVNMHVPYSSGIRSCFRCGMKGARTRHELDGHISDDAPRVPKIPSYFIKRLPTHCTKKSTRLLKYAKFGSKTSFCSKCCLNACTGSKPGMVFTSTAGIRSDSHTAC